MEKKVDRIKESCMSECRLVKWIWQKMFAISLNGTDRPSMENIPCAASSSSAAVSATWTLIKNIKYNFHCHWGFACTNFHLCEEIKMCLKKHYQIFNNWLNKIESFTHPKPNVKQSTSRSNNLSVSLKLVMLLDLSSNFAGKFSKIIFSTYIINLELFSKKKKNIFQTKIRLKLSNLILIADDVLLLFPNAECERIHFCH